MKIRKINILLLILTSIVLLGHSIVPHHHHQSYVCLVESHCDNGTKFHQQENADCEHQHDGKDDSRYCALQQTVFLPQNLYRQYFDNIDQSLNLDFLYQFLSGTDNASPGAFMLDVNNKAREFLTVQSAFTNYIAQSKGLRAPPNA